MSFVRPREDTTRQVRETRDITRDLFDRTFKITRRPFKDQQREILPRLFVLQALMTGSLICNYSHYILPTEKLQNQQNCI